MNKSTRREFLKQASASLMALALLPILPVGNKFMVVGLALGEDSSSPISQANGVQRGNL